MSATFTINGVKTSILFIILILLTFSLSAQQLAFPTASGAGAYVTGGRGKPVYIVTNLNDSGPGSFRQCLEDTKLTDGGIITFAVSGTINLNSEIYFYHQDNITIAGQTAPEGGITIANHRFRMQNVNNFIMRYIRLRPNFDPYPATELDPLEYFNAHDYIIDHCSFSWGTDEAAESGIGHTYTWQRNLFAESNKTGMIIGYDASESYNESFLNNMFYNCSHRFPNWISDDRVDIINNVVWNWRTRMSVPQGGFEVNHINNYYVHYTNSPPADTDIRGILWHPFNVQDGGPSLFPTIYTSGNYISDVLTDPNADNWFFWRFRFNPSGTQYSGAGNESPLTTDFRTFTPFPQLGNPITIKSAEAAFNDLKYNVGANARLDENGNIIEEIDAPDEIYLSNVQSGTIVPYTQESNMTTAHFAAFQNTVSSTPINTGYTDSNSDGMPDAWKISKGFGIDDDLTSHVWPSGYVGIEEFLNAIDGTSTLGNSVNAGTDQSICEGESVTLTASGVETYAWSTGETTAEITVSPDTTTTYIVTGTDLEGNTSTDELIVTVHQLPTANAGNDVTIDAGESTTLTASGGDSYVWNTGENTQSISVSPETNTSYAVTVFQNGCEDTNTVTVFVNPIIIAYAGEDQTICEGETAVLTASGGDSYLWNTGESSQTITVDPNNTTTYTVTVFISNNSDTDEVTVNVNQNPIANAGNDVSIDQGESTTLTASGGDLYEWSTGETTQSITVSPSQSTTYSVSVSLNGCEDFDEVIVIVNDVNANAGEDQTICEGASTVLSASGGDSYSWSTGETTQDIEVSPNETTTYTVLVTTTNGSDEDDVLVTVNPNPVANAGEDITINAGESVVLTASGGDSYTWSTGETTQSIEVAPNVTTSYTVSVALDGCVDLDEVVVMVNSGITADAGEDVTICQGESTVLTASGGDSYLWSTGETTASITVDPIATSNYTVSVSNEFSSDTDMVTVVVNPLPNVQVNDDVTILHGNFVTLSASGANTYLWNNGAIEPNIAVSPEVTTTYSVTGFINNCSETEEVTVNVVETVTAEAGPNETICFGDTITLTAAGGDNYLWNTGETTQSITVSPSEETTYTVIVSNTLDSDADEVTISVENCEIEIPNGETAYEYSLYSNPSNPGVIMVKLIGLEGNARLFIHDIRGKLIDQLSLSDNDGQEQNIPINTNYYERGVYMITLKESNRITPKRVLFR